MSTTAKRYAGPRTLAATKILLTLTAVAALIAGPSYWINGLTQVGFTVQVPVRYASVDDTGTLPGPDGAPATINLPLPLSIAAPAEGDPSAPDVMLTVANDDLALAATGGTAAEYMLVRGDDLLEGLTVGLGAILLWQVLNNVGRGQPFARGNAARIAGVAGAVAVASFVAPFLPPVATGLVLARLGADDGSLQATSDLDFAPLLLIGLLLVLAEAVRHGERLARDSDGLV